MTPQGQLVDETYYKEGPFLTEYDRTKWLAHYKVALPLIEKGAPIVIVMPGGVYGPGDTSFIAQLMRMFYRGLPALPGSDLTVTYAHVDDVAQGHLLAADSGKVGESYILAGPAIPLNEMVDFWAHLIGRKPPSLRLAGRPLRKFAPVAGAVSSVLPLPSLFSEEAVGSLGASYMARPESVAQIRARGTYYPNLVPGVPRQFRRMSDGDLLEIGGRQWRCISGYGHAPEHMALYCEAKRILIGGDMMLPRISTNVSVYETEPEANALKQFLDSIDRFSALPEDTLTLPSHGKPFIGLHVRIGQLHDHHRDRLDEVLQVCAQQARCAADILPVLFKRPLDLHQKTFAMGEAVAHLHALWYAGQLRRTLDSDGVYRFTASSR